MFDKILFSSGGPRTRASVHSMFGSLCAFDTEKTANTSIYQPCFFYRGAKNVVEHMILVHRTPHDSSKSFIPVRQPAGELHEYLFVVCSSRGPGPKNPAGRKVFLEKMTFLFRKLVDARAF